MEDLVLSIPIQDAAFIETLVQRMGWTMRRRSTSVERFISSCPKAPQRLMRKSRQKSTRTDKDNESIFLLSLAESVPS